MFIIAAAFTPNVYKATLLPGFKAGQKLDVDFIGVNCPIHNSNQVKMLVKLVGHTLHCSPHFQPVRDMHDKSKFWLQLSSSPWVLRIDTSEFSGEQMIEYKRRICEHLREMNHSAIPNPDPQVRTIHMGYVYKPCGLHL